VDRWTDGSKNIMSLTFKDVFHPSTKITQNGVAELQGIPYHMRSHSCYLPPDIGERALPQPRSVKPVLDFSAQKGWKAQSPSSSSNSHYSLAVEVMTFDRKSTQSPAFIGGNITYHRETSLGLVWFGC